MIQSSCLCAPDSYPVFFSCPSVNKYPRIRFFSTYRRFRAPFCLSGTFDLGRSNPANTVLPSKTVPGPSCPSSLSPSPSGSVLFIAAEKHTHSSRADTDRPALHTPFLLESIGDANKPSVALPGRRVFFFFFFPGLFLAPLTEKTNKKKKVSSLASTDASIDAEGDFCGDHSPSTN